MMKTSENILPNIFPSQWPSLYALPECSEMASFMVLHGLKNNNFLAL